MAGDGNDSPLSEENQQATRAVLERFPDLVGENFQQILASFTGKIVTVVNPESFEDGPVGHRLTTGFYKAKVVQVGDDFITLATEMKRRSGKEAVRQFVPIDRIKRINILKGDRLIHL